MLIVVAAIVSFLTGGTLVGFLTFPIWKQAKSLDKQREDMGRAKESLERERAKLQNQLSAFRSRIVNYDELVHENDMLKADLLNVDVTLRKLEMDRDGQAQRQSHIDDRAQALADRYLRDVEKWVGTSINANNYAACKQRLTKAIEWCRTIGFDVDAEREEQLLSDLKADFEKAVRVALEREEQARIKKQIREEQAREREAQREIDRHERERAAIQAALEKALAQTQDVHSAEIESLRARLAEAEAGKERAVSQAQLTRAGHIYIISNLGAFGENVFKIGMTRRLEPSDRIKELGDASVPFPFDVHMMISSDDAPSLESALHRRFHRHRLNRVNPRKEFFRVDLSEIRDFVEAHHGEVDYMADAEALEYRQSLEMSDEDQEYLDSVFARAEQELGLPDADE